MANMESFYAGRQGASFVIVERFDCITFRSNDDTCRKKCYAKDDHNYYYYPLVERTSENHSEYINWGYLSCNGKPTTIETHNSEDPENPIEVSVTLPLVPAKSMVECFIKGGATTNEVNYGEYVIIDGNMGFYDRNSPDNGKVYRRGMNYTGDLGGAEYIGQIVGPQGDSPELIFTNLNDIQGGTEISYTVDNGSLVPGYVDGEIETFNDEIKYRWVTIKDDAGCILGCKIGFQVPYLVQDFNANARSLYYEKGDIIPEGKLIGDIITDSNFSFIDGEDTGHPFYKKWKIHVPKGIKGDSIVNVEKYPAKVGIDAAVYTENTLENEITDPQILENINRIITSIDEDNNQAVVLGNNAQLFYSSIDDAKWRLRYIPKVFDEKADGEIQTSVDIGEYNMIKDITIDDNGNLTVYYTYNDEYSQKLKTISNVYIDAKGAVKEEGQGDQQVHIVYNTDAEGKSHAIGDPINYIIDTVVSDWAVPHKEDPDAGYNPEKESLLPDAQHLLIYFSDPKTRKALPASKSKYYYSQKLGKFVDGWYDMGYIRGEAGGVHIIGNVENLSDLYSDHDPEGNNGIKPENILGQQDMTHAGWNMTVGDVIDETHPAKIYAYDYKTGKWYPIGNLDESLIKVDTFINISDVEPETDYLRENGIWAVVSTIKCAY